jgi:hypothetical protein
MPSGRRASGRSRLVLRRLSGSLRRSSFALEEDIECAELDLLVVPTRVQRVEVGDAVYPAAGPN